MVFLHLVNLVTRTHETDETQSISFGAASCAALPVYERDGFSFCTHCDLSRGSEKLEKELMFEKAKDWSMLEETGIAFF